MRAAIINAYGGPSVLTYASLPDPIAAEHEVVVEVRAAGVNPVDGIYRRGEMRSWRELDFPAVLGWDVAGVVRSVGKAVTDLVVGDRVAGWADHSYAELCAVNSDLLVRIPDAMDFEAAAAVPLAAMTGSQMANVGADVAAGQRVLIAGALGSVGRVVYAARKRGAHVIVAVRQAKLEEARALGADEAVALDDEAALDALEPVDVVVNTIRGPLTGRLLGKIRQGGLYVSATGAPEGGPQRPDVRIVDFASKKNRSNLQEMLAAVASGALEIPIGHRFPLSQAADAHRALESGASAKIILLP